MSRARDPETTEFGTEDVLDEIISGDDHDIGPEDDGILMERYGRTEPGWSVYIDEALEYVDEEDLNHPLVRLLEQGGKISYQGPGVSGDLAKVSENFRTTRIEQFPLAGEDEGVCRLEVYAPGVPGVAVRSVSVTYDSEFLEDSYTLELTAEKDKTPNISERFRFRTDTGTESSVDLGSSGLDPEVYGGHEFR